jgi:glyoxylase-like metal-dependent hydrolase (beta-lactamase superfamily II)
MSKTPFVATTIPFVREMEFDYGAVDRVAPGLRRVIAKNPSKYTFHGSGTYVVGNGEVAVIDPGPDDDAHLTALLVALEGESVSHILVTHTHRDHSPLARRLAAETGAPIWGCAPHATYPDWPDDPADETDATGAGPAGGTVISAEAEEEESDSGTTRGAGDASTAEGESTERGFDEDHDPHRQLVHGDLVEGSGWRIEAVHTPGHTSNHLCFALDEGSLFTGDHVMGWSTSVIGPPDGDMGAYLGSLALLLERPDRVYWPTHGPPVTDPQPFVRAFIAHRDERERSIVELLRSAGPSRIDELVAVLYASVDERLHQPAARSVHSHLLRLAEAGVVDADGDRRLRSASVWRSL